MSYENETDELYDEAVSHPINLGEDEEVFELLAGYKDKDGIVHTDFALREMTGKDEEAIHSKSDRNNGSRVASTLLARCVTRLGSLTPKSVGKEKWENIIKSLYVGDQDYMLMQLRKISMGDEIKVNHVCPNPECKAKLDTIVSVDELEIIPFSGNTSFPFELPKGYKDRKGEIHKEGTITTPTGLDREVLTPLARTNLAKAETAMLTRLCRFNDGTPIDEDAMRSLSMKDRDYLQRTLKENYFGYNLDLEIVCDSCGEVFTGSLNASNFI